MTTPPPTNSTSSDLGYYLRKWYLFVIFLAAFLALAYYYLQEAVPEYYIGSTLYVRENVAGEEPKVPDGFADLDLYSPISKVEDEIEILKSDSLMLRALDSLEQQVQYYVEQYPVYVRDLDFRIVPGPDFLAEEVIRYEIDFTGPRQFIIREAEPEEEGEIDATTYTFGEPIDHPFGTFRVIADSTTSFENYSTVGFEFWELDELQADYSETFVVSQINLASSVISMGIVDPVPQRAVDILNLVIEGYLASALREKNQVALNTLELIDQRLVLLTDELSNVERNVELYKQQQSLTDVSSESELYLQRANDYSRELGDYELRLDILNSIERYVSEPVEAFTAVPSSLSIQDPTLTALVTRFNEVQLERQNLLQNSTPNNPLVISLNRQLTNLRSNILENIANIKEGLSIIKDNLEVNRRRFEEQIRRVPSIERDLIEIKRQQGIKNNLYLYLLQKREEMALSLATGVPALRVISPPRPYEDPVNDQSTLLYFAAILGGILFPFSILFVRRKLFNKVQTPADIKQRLPVPVLGEIGHKKGKQDLIITSDNNMAAAELFRLLIYNLEFTYDPPTQAIIVTSVKSGEGKSFISRNIGASLALTDKRVVVVGMDLRNPKELYADSGREVGVTDFLKNGDLTSIDSLLTTSDTVEGLYFIASGSLPSNPAQLMRGDRMRQLIQELRMSFDYVILDTAPIGRVSDAYALSRLADLTLLVVRSGYTTIPELEILEEVSSNGKLPRPSIVLNDYDNEILEYGYGKNG